MIFVLYYSEKTITPALLAAISHCHPDLPPEQLRLRAAGWLQRELAGKKPSALLVPFAVSPGGETVCLGTGGVPPPLLRRTLGGLSRLLGKGPGQPVLLTARPLPPAPARLWKAPCRETSAFWKELEALVEQTRLQAELLGEQ